MNDQLKTKLTDLRHQFDAFLAEASEARGDTPEAAAAAFPSYAWTTPETRAAFLNRVADEIEARAEAITEIGTAETGLPVARLEGERGRTTGQLRFFAGIVAEGRNLDVRHDKALPDRAPLPRPELLLTQRPIGPVAVFGASNFPLAFSTAGGDTASALAAGCPVVVKGHEAHPGTAQIVAEAVDAARAALDLHPGVFSMVHGGSREAAQALVTHPAIKAVGFTGSTRAGRALFDLCAGRPEPIPFYGELGSVNPMFFLPGAVAAHGAEIGAGWAGSLTMGAGQFCTNPGIGVGIRGPELDSLADALAEGLAEVPEQRMLTDGIAAAFQTGCNTVASTDGLTPILAKPSSGRTANPAAYRVSAEQFLASEILAHEVFGPLALLVEVADADEMERVAQSFTGQLTAGFHLDPSDHDLARTLLPHLERRAGRILANGFPTGVEVAYAMVHGGPWPASTNFGGTSVGAKAIERFQVNVCYQNLPSDLLPGSF